MQKTRNVLHEIVEIFIKKKVSRAAAQLSYNLTLSIFPLLICVIAMLSGLELSDLDLMQFGGDIVPEATIQIVSDYVEYVMANYSAGMLAAALALLATTSSAGFRAIIGIMAEIEGEARYKGFWATVLSFVFSLLFLASIYVSIIIMVTGNWFLQFIADIFKMDGINTGVWQWIRFILLFAVVVSIVYGIYRLTAPKEKPLKQRVIGAVAAAVALVAISIFSSWTFMMSTRYSLIYGSLASIIVLMVWFFICGNVVIGGNVLNYVLNKHVFYR